METRVRIPTEEELLQREAEGDCYVTDEEYFAMFDEAVRKKMGISGDEFIERWNAGEYDEIIDTAGYLHLTSLEFMIPHDRRKR